MNKRLSLQTEEILTALRFAGDRGVTNADLAKIALKYGSRIHDLVKKGYVIKTESLGSDGLFLYTLISEPDADFQAPPKALDILLSEVGKVGLVTKTELEGLIEKLNLNVRYNVGTHKKIAKGEMA